MKDSFGVHKEIKESQTVEFKEAWRDEYLKTVCAFANTSGGALYIGVNDKGDIVGVNNIKKLVEDLPNKVMNAFVISVHVEIGEKNKKQFIKMTVPGSNAALSYQGKFYTRSGSTTQELRGGALQRLLLRANNLSWDEIGIDDASYDDIDNETVLRFVIQATEYNRLPLGIDGKNIERLFQNLGLLTKDGKLTRAAVLLFGKEPIRFFRCAAFQIGRFKGVDPTDLIIQDRIDGNLFVMFEQAINFLKSKYLLSPISYLGMRRIETLEIPDKAIREAILNALIHRDYTSPTAISLRVYDPTVSIWNAGELENITVEDLGAEHSSHLRNPLIANMFYRAGYIEAWGRGTLTIVSETVKNGLPKPLFKTRQGGLEVIFQRDASQASYAEKILDIETEKVGEKVGENGTDVTENDINVAENGVDVTEKVVDVTERVGEIGMDVTENGVDVTESGTDVTDDVVKDIIAKREREILSLIGINNHISTTQMAEKMAVTRMTIHRDLERLKSKNLIERVGADRGGYWRVLQ